MELHEYGRGGEEPSGEVNSSGLRVGVAAILVFFGVLWLASFAFQAAFGREGYDQNGRPLICDAYDTDGNVVMTPEQLAACKKWITNVVQPSGSPSCCGEADAFEANDFKTDPDGRLFAVVTQAYPMNKMTAYPDGLKPGDRVLIPPGKINDAVKQGNPTGRGIVFLNTAGNVLCYFGPWGN